MNMLALGFVDSWLTIAAAIGVAWLVWIFCNRVADAWRGLAQPSAEDGGQPSREKAA